MANQELTDLQILTSLADADVFFVRDVSTSIDKQVTVATMAVLFGGGTFLSHTDTPVNYTTAENKFVRVDSTGTGLVFVDDPGYLTDITAELLGDLSDVVVTGTPTGELLAFTGSIWENQTLAEVGIAPVVHTHVEADITDLQDYTLVGHTHVEADITDLQAYLLNITGEDFTDLSDTPANYSGSGAMFVRVSIGESELEFVDLTSGDLPSHTHVEADIMDLQNYSLDGHTHVEADITDLQAYLLNITSESIEDLSDVIFTTLVAGEFLRFNGTNWVNVSLTLSDLPALVLDDLTDVDTMSVTPVSGDCLAFNGSLWVPTVGLAPGAHASTHDRGGTDEIDGDVLDITFAPTNYTRTTAPSEVTVVDQLTAHLAGIDTRLGGTFDPTAHTHDAADVNSGTFVDARISQSSVTQHEAAIDHDALLNFVSNEHIDHSIITLSAGIGLSGGGNITVSRTFNLDIPSLPVDAFPLGSYTLAAHDGAAHKVVTLTDLLSVGGFLTAEVNDLNTAVTWADVPNANITESSVTQHQAALSITENQISDLQPYLLDINSQSISELSDVDTTGVNSGDVLQWDGFNWLPIAADTPGAHASTHLQGGGDEIDGDNLDIDYFPTNYVATATAPALSADTVTGHLAGIDADLGALDTAIGNLTFTDLTDTPADYIGFGSFFVKVNSGATGLEFVVDPGFLLNINVESIDELSDVDTSGGATTGDVLSWNGSNWIPATGSVPGAHASTHVSGGSDQIDGDVLDITFVPSNYTRLTSPGEVTAVVELTAHLAGINAELATFALSAHTHTLVDITDSGTAASKDFPFSGDAAAGEVVLGDDSRLTDSRTPTAHVHSTADITTGTFVDARIAESNVTQHEAAINHDALLNFVANEHVDHSIVTLTAGIGLTGGGTIAASRTFALDIPGLDDDGSPAGTYTLAVHDGTTHKEVTLTNLLGVGGFLTAEVNDLTSAVVWDDVPDANITESSVTQHQAALSITENQISNLAHVISVQDGGVPVTATPHGTLNFVGAGVTATDGTGGVATITIPGGAGVSALNDLNDVTITTPATGEFLRKSGTDWVNVPIVEADISDLQSYSLPGHTHLEADITDLTRTIIVEDTGSGVAGGPHDTLDFVGSGVVVTDAGGGTATITISAGGATDLDGLTDVTISAPATGHFIRKSAGNWLNTFIVEADISDLQAYLTDITGESIGNLSDVTFVDAADGDFLRFNGTSWVDAVITEADISDLTHAISVEDEGSPVTGGPHSTMNFVGAGVVVADVSGVATVTISGGGGGGTYDCQEAVATTTASTNSTSFIDLGQMTLTTKNLGETGTYKITFSCSVNSETRRRTYRFRIVVDGTPFGEEFLGTSPDRATDEHSLSFTQTISGLASGKVIKIQFAIDDDTNGNAVNVFNRSLVILGVPDSEVVA